MLIRIVPFLLLASLSACQIFGDADQPRAKDIRDIVWQKERMELYNANLELLEVIPATDCEKEELLKFEKGGKLLRISRCDGDSARLECGQWELNRNGLLVFLGITPLVPNVCKAVNFQWLILGTKKG